MQKNYIVYKHTSPSNKIYIGITCQKPKKRWNNGKGYIQHKHFYNAIQKYGWENINHEILFENLSKEEACQKEIELIAFYKSNDREFGYNSSSGGESGCKGCHWNLSEETKKKISETKKGYHWSEEMKKKLSEAHKEQVAWNKGKKGLQVAWNKGKTTTSKLSRKVICLETGVVYDTISAASKATKCWHIKDVCEGVRKITKGFTWRYVDETQ